eukprot:TRINITY_DN66893_c0_g1_i1.p1 TRINITY_DN66893_c0_g1~~TRINITY_DN66893_c0_g1_i1.p1  ORF type:complete len:346 (+),score=74.87 TRINITY_DN66893_c0_g1_i1:64-1101(+)
MSHMDEGLRTNEEGDGSLDADKAAKILEEAMAEKDRGAALYKEQNFNEARIAWLEALRMIPQEMDSNMGRMKLSLHLNLAQVCLQLKVYDSVVAHATEALIYEQDSAKALYRRGLANDALGKFQTALADLKQAARLEPRNADIRKKYEEVKKKVQDMDEHQMEDEFPPEHNLAALPRAFLDVAIGDQEPQRVVFALYSDTVPKTVENFCKLCSGAHEGLTARGKPFHYKGSILHRKISGLMIQGGDFENANGTGGESIYGRRFPDEGFRDKMKRRGLLGMANDGPNTNGSNFFITFAPIEHLNRKHVIFGEVFGGLDFLEKLEDLPTDDECRPLTDCVIVDCGVC